MAAAIRFTKAEIAAIKHAFDECVTCPKGVPRSAFDSALAKIEASERPKETRGAGLAVTDALDAFKSALGDRLVVPPTPGKPWWAMMGNGLKKYGLSRQQCATVAKVAGAKWRGFIKAESLVRQASVLLAESQLELPETGGPTEMDDLE